VTMSEKLCVKWNEFQQNLNTALGSLRNDNDFSDITLVCKDGQKVDAHKFVLAASSKFFQNLLRKNKHQHPLVYMRGMRSEDILAIIDFIYFGEANVNHENLDEFLAIAEELNIKGLTGVLESVTERDPMSIKEQGKYAPKLKTPKTENFATFKTDSEIVTETRVPEFVENLSEKATAFSVDSFFDTKATYIRQLDDQVKSLMAKSNNMVAYGPKNYAKADYCTICGKEGRRKDIKDHIEANHLEGLSVPCNFCEKTYKSRNSLKNHIRASHKKT